MHGIGIYTWADKKQYEGEYYKDKKDGYGRYSWPDGRIYKGYWKDGKQHGLGEQVVAVGGASTGVKNQVRFGQWIEGKRTQWFAVSKENDLVQQLDAIEEAIF